MSSLEANTAHSVGRTCPHRARFFLLASSNLGASEAAGRAAAREEAAGQHLETSVPAASTEGRRPIHPHLEDAESTAAATEVVSGLTRQNLEAWLEGGSGSLPPGPLPKRCTTVYKH